MHSVTSSKLPCTLNLTLPALFPAPLPPPRPCPHPPTSSSTPQFLPCPSPPTKGWISRAPVSTPSPHSVPTVATEMESIRQIAFSVELLFHNPMSYASSLLSLRIPNELKHHSDIYNLTHASQYSLCTVSPTSSIYRSNAKPSILLSKLYKNM